MGQPDGTIDSIEQIGRDLQVLKQNVPDVARHSLVHLEPHRRRARRIPTLSSSIGLSGYLRLRPPRSRGQRRN